MAALLSDVYDKEPDTTQPLNSNRRGKKQGRMALPGNGKDRPIGKRGPGVGIIFPEKPQMEEAFPCPMGYSVIDCAAMKPLLQACWKL